MAAQGVKPRREMGVELARRYSGGQVNATTTQTPVHAVRDMAADGPAGPIPVRVYWPTGASIHPVALYFHGGGHVLGDLDSHDNIARELAVASDSVVVAVHYRRAPEDPFPAAVEDAFASVKWVAKHAAELRVDAHRMALVGDSAGGNLVAAISILARDNGGPHIALQVLRYGSVDMTSLDTDSGRKFATGYRLLRSDVEWFRDLYVPDESQRRDWRASPLLAPDLSNLPPAIIMTAEFDILHDQGEAFADRLAEAGNQVTYKCYDGLIHGFFNLTGRVDRASAALTELGQWMKERLAVTDVAVAHGER